MFSLSLIYCYAVFFQCIDSLRHCESVQCNLVGHRSLKMHNMSYV